MTISDKRLKELERAEKKLNALEAGGVDNWDNYDDALKHYWEENELEERKEALVCDLEVIFGGCAFEPSERGAGIAFTEEAFENVMQVLDDHGVIFKDKK